MSEYTGNDRVGKAVYAEEVLREVVADNISKVDEKEFDRFFSYAETYYEKWSILLR